MRTSTGLTTVPHKNTEINTYIHVHFIHVQCTCTFLTLLASFFHLSLKHVQCTYFEWVSRLGIQVSLAIIMCVLSGLWLGGLL